MSPWRILSLLLEYPDEDLLACSEELGAAARDLPPSAARESILSHLAAREGPAPGRLQREYVETFDFAKRATLYLSFHAYGDRRQRGMAMLHLKHAYMSAGLELAPGALPDHLPTMLEFAGASPGTGAELLADFRPALEIVRGALHQEGSAYARLLDAVCSLLPKASAQDLDDARRIAAEGPPGEAVGLEPFSPPEAMPASCPAPALTGATRRAAAR
jgi:nitrate reductase delta subunit